MSTSVPAARLVAGSTTRITAPGPVEALRIVRQLTGTICIFPKGELTSGSWWLDVAARGRFPRYITIEHKAQLPLPPRSRRRHLGGLVPGLGLWWYAEWLQKYLRGLAPHRVVCVSGNVAARLHEDYRFSPDKLTIVRNGVDTTRFAPNDEYRRTTRAAWGVPADALVYGAIGRFHSWKGFDTGLQAFRQLLASTPGRDVRLVLAGEGPQHETLQRLASQPEMGGRVQLLPFSARPWEIYPALDVFIMPSRNEGLPLSLLEAMACGCSPVAMGVGGIPEVLQDAGSGWLVTPGDAPGFTGAMADAARQSAAALATMGARARAHVVRHFEASAQFAALADAIERECGCEGPRHAPAAGR